MAGSAAKKILEKIEKNPERVICGSEVTGGSYFNLSRASFNDVSPTITATGGQFSGVCHPTEDRKISIPELKRIASLPDDFIVTGTYTQQWERIGRMVPPLMMYRIAKTIQTDILDKVVGENYEG
jgi:DNA (cytosine-5)-methyltransferase 1